MDFHANLVSNLLAAAPPGQLPVVGARVAELGSAAKDTLEDVAAEAFLAHHLATYAALPLDDDEALAVAVVCEDLQLPAPDEKKDEDGGATLFVEPRTRKVVTVDAVAMKGKVLRDATEQEAPVSKARDAMDEAMQGYLKRTVPQGNCAVVAKDDGDTLVVVITNRASRETSFLAGAWRARWKLSNAKAAGKKATLQGEAHVFTHCYEDGNVQMSSTNTFDSIELDVKDKANPQELAKAAVEAIEKAETKYLKQLTSTMANAEEGALSQLRRKLPVTRMAFPWEGHGVSLASELKRHERAPVG
ncbi:F-actin-capping protein subunit alpha [Pycnococcus provasolii]